MSDDDEPQLPEFLLNYALRVGELIDESGALKHWRQQCHKSYQEHCKRLERHKSWERQQLEFIKKEWTPGGKPAQNPPKKGMQFATVRLVSPDRKKTWLAEGWLP